jgi:hypothetical protein
MISLHAPLVSCQMRLMRAQLSQAIEAAGPLTPLHRIFAKFTVGFVARV